MKPLLLALAVLVALAGVTSAAADPLICVDPGAIEIEDVITIDIPEICVL